MFCVVVKDDSHCQRRILEECIVDRESNLRLLNLLSSLRYITDDHRLLASTAQIFPLCQCVVLRSLNTLLVHA